MLRKKKKIPCYVLVFDQTEIVKKTLEFLARSADKLEIIVIENPSDNTPEISEVVQALAKSGAISRYYLFDENITNNAFNIVLTKEMSTIKKSRYVITTDGDLTCPDDSWLDEVVTILDKHPEVFVCGVSLSTKNLPLKTFPTATEWLPPDKSEQPDYYEALTGSHLMMIRGKEFSAFFDWKNKTGAHLVDGTMHTYCYDVIGKKWARTKKAEAWHLTWDLYNDLNHPYTKLKLSKDFVATWRHQLESGYKLTDFTKNK